MANVKRVYDEFQFENARREREQRERRQAAEIDYLEEAADYREYRRRRGDQLIVEPALPEDEMTMADYKLVRAADPDLEVLADDEDNPSYAVLPTEHRR